MHSRQAAGYSPQRNQPPFGSCLLAKLAGARQIKEAAGRWQAVQLAAPLLVKDLSLVAAPSLASKQQGCRRKVVQ